MVECGKRVVECSDIPSAAALTEIYEKNFIIDTEKRLEVIKHRLIIKLNNAAERGQNYCVFWEDDIPCGAATYYELNYFKKELKKLGFKAKLKVDDSWATKWYLSISWGKNIDLRDIL